jgi:hypothetical protein
VTLGLFGAFAFGFGARAFGLGAFALGLFGLRRGRRISSRYLL